MTTYEPGTVAVATVRGVKGVRIMRTDGIGGGDTIWLSVGNVDHWRTHYDRDVTEIRPLVVLDPESDLVKYFVRSWAHIGRGLPPGVTTADLAREIEAQTKPPRIPEPGLWGVVEAKHPDSGRLRLRFVRVDDSYPRRWQPVCMNYSEPLTWGDLIDPTLVREGLS